jgi:hypothetical protein
LDAKVKPWHDQRKGRCPTAHRLRRRKKSMDGRHKAGHDDIGVMTDGSQ